MSKSPIRKPKIAEKYFLKYLDSLMVQIVWKPAMGINFQDITITDICIDFRLLMASAFFVLFEPFVLSYGLHLHLHAPEIQMPRWKDGKMDFNS